MSRAMWGRPGAGSNWTNGFFRGRAGVVVEIAPNRFMSWRMRGCEGEVEANTDYEDIGAADWLGPLVRIPTLTTVRFELSGYLDASDEHAPRPDWAADVPEIGARRGIGGGR